MTPDHIHRAVSVSGPVINLSVEMYMATTEPSDSSLSLLKLESR